MYITGKIISKVGCEVIIKQNLTGYIYKTDIKNVKFDNKSTLPFLKRSVRVDFMDVK